MKIFFQKKKEPDSNRVVGSIRYDLIDTIEFINRRYDVSISKSNRKKWFICILYIIDDI